MAIQASPRTVTVPVYGGGHLTSIMTIIRLEYASRNGYTYSRLQSCAVDQLVEPFRARLQNVVLPPTSTSGRSPRIDHQELDPSEADPWKLRESSERYQRTRRTAPPQIVHHRGRRQGWRDLRGPNAKVEQRRMDANARASTTHRGLLTRRNRSGKLRMKENRQVPLTDGHEVVYDRAWQLLFENPHEGPSDMPPDGELR